MKESYIVKSNPVPDTPLLLFYPDIIKQNIQLALTIAGSPAALRPHVKTDKIIEVVKLLQQFSIDQFKCATIAEAEMLALCGAKDVLLAYQPGLAKLQRFYFLSQAYPHTHFSCLVDTIETLDLIENVWQGNPLSVYIDINVGMNRTGIQCKDVYTLYEKSRQYKSIHFAGLHVYDGHIDDQSADVRKQKASFIWKEVTLLKTRIEKKSGELIKLVIAGSPTFRFYANWALEQKVPLVEVSPGTFTLWDQGYLKILSDLPFRPAVILLNRIVSIPDPELVCIDLGYKAVSAENSLDQRASFLNIPLAEPISQSEEHFVIKVPDSSIYQVGYLVYSIPWHVCPTVALYDSVEEVQEGIIVTEWKVIARNRKINY